MDRIEEIAGGPQRFWVAVVALTTYHRVLLTDRLHTYVTLGTDLAESSQLILIASHVAPGIKCGKTSRAVRIDVLRKVS